MRVVLILVVLVGALFFHVSHWLKHLTPVDVTEYTPYVLEVVEPTDVDHEYSPTNPVD